MMFVFHLRGNFLMRGCSFAVDGGLRAKPELFFLCTTTDLFC